jgi:hypothetical protein
MGANPPDRLACAYFSGVAGVHRTESSFITEWANNADNTYGVQNEGYPDRARS